MRDSSFATGELEGRLQTRLIASTDTNVTWLSLILELGRARVGGIDPGRNQRAIQLRTTYLSPPSTKPPIRLADFFDAPEGLATIYRELSALVEIEDGRG